MRGSPMFVPKLALISLLGSLVVLVTPATGHAAPPTPPASARAPANASAARERLIAALSSLDTAVPATTLRGLAGDQTARLLATIVLDSAVRGGVRLRAAASLHTLADAAALRESLRLLDAPALETRLRWHVGYGAIVLGGRIDQPAAIDLATRWLAAADVTVRDAAVRALGHVPGDAATQLLQRARVDADAEVRAVAARLLARR